MLAIFGDHDTIVDWRQSEAGYRRALGDRPGADLTIVTIPKADHAMFLSRTGGMKEIDAAFSNPVKTFAPGYFERMGEWLVVRFGDAAKQRSSAPGD